MATDTPPTSNKKAPSFMEWDYLSEGDLIKLQEEFTKFLNKPETLQTFGEACKHIGEVAIAIDEDFRTVKNGFATLVEKYGNDFPDVGKMYVPRWDGFIAHWNGEAGLLWSSRKLAADTAATLTDYGIALGLVADIKTQDDLKNAQTELQDYAKRHPGDVPTQVAEEFKNLRNNIQAFLKDFTTYIEEQKQKLSDNARYYEYEIKHYQVEITRLNNKIVLAFELLGCSFALGVIDSLIPLAVLVAVLVARITAQQNLDAAKANLANTVRKQQALAAMQADFESLKPNIDDICTKLGVFAEIWGFTTKQSWAINTELQEGMEVLMRKEFQAKLGLLRAQVEPLKETICQPNCAVIHILSLEQNERVHLIRTKLK